MSAQRLDEIMKVLRGPIGDDGQVDTGQVVTHKKTCRGCNLELPLDQFSRDASKPDGHHSRCTPCKTAGKRRVPATLLFLVPAPKPPKPKPTPPPAPRTVDVAAALRRDALVELVRRHRREFDDICAVMRQERTPENPTRQWRSATNLASVASQ